MRLYLKLQFSCSLFCILLSFSTKAAESSLPKDLFTSSPKHQQIAKKNLSKNTFDAPDWALWDGDEIILKVSRLALGKTFLFGINCTSGDHCRDSFATTAAQRIKFEVRAQQLLLLADDHSHSVALDPITRWDVVKKDETHLYVKPSLKSKLNFTYLSVQESLENSYEAKIYDRFFHDTRSHEKGGIWFHETIRYQHGASASDESSHAATTFTHYILPITELTSNYRPKKAVENFGYFVNSNSFADEEGLIYAQRGDEFNQNSYKAARWYRDREIEWVVQRSVSDEIYRLIERGIMNWSAHLPDSLSLKVRRANRGEELDSPYINPFMYTAQENRLGGVGNATHDKTTGEIIRGAVALFGPGELPKKEQREATPKVNKRSNNLKAKLTMTYAQLPMSRTCDMDIVNLETKTRKEIIKTIISVTSHEIGHTLGLRHNFLGHSYDERPKEFPAGSSVMDYAKDYQDLKIGPYDVEAIKWGYSDESPNNIFKFCSDETVARFKSFSLNPECRAGAPLSANLFERDYNQLYDFLYKTLPDNSNDIDYIEYNVLSKSINLSNYFMRSMWGPYYQENQAQKAKDIILRKLQMMQAPEDFGIEDKFTFLQKTIYETSSLFSAISKAKKVTTYNPVSFLSNADLYIHHRELMKQYFDVLANNLGASSKKNIAKNIAQWMDEDPDGFYLATMFRDALKEVANTTSDSELKKENEMVLYQMKN